MCSSYAEYRDVPLVSISNAQRMPLPGANWQATVYHGLPRDLYQFCRGPARYLAFVGRVSPEKRLDRAIQMAQAVGIPLKVAAKVDQVDQRYFDTTIAPLLESPGVEFVGEIGEADKCDFLGGAAALLFPVDWPEPFGLVMIEAMACGTPVVAFRCGAVPEIVDPGVTGCIVNTLDEAVQAIGQAAAFDRRRIRQVFERRFTAERMARDYLGVYKRLGRTQAPAA